MKYCNMFKLRLLVFVLTFNLLNMNAQEKSDMVEIVGTAYDVKGGAIVQTDSVDYWVEGMDCWEEKYFQKKVKVIGELKYRKDNRVFVDTGELTIQGIPVKTKEEMDSYPDMVWIVPIKIELIADN